MVSNAKQTTTACVECKRMKLRCDKKIPCNSCVRRGCSNICPTGKLAPGKGTRFILDGTEQLHAKIQKLQSRVLQLEDALTAVYAKISNEPHPLLDGLGDPDLSIPRSAEAETAIQEATDSLGTLAIEELGNTKYFGPSAGTETLFQAASSNFGDTPNPACPSNRLEPQLRRLSSQFPFALDYQKGSLTSILQYFPERLKAWSLCELYTEQFAWSYTPVLREELIDEFFAPTYRALEIIRQSPQEAETLLRPHHCAVLFLVFAIGTWVDLTQTQYWEEADHFYELGRACISMQSVFEAPECATVQAIHLVAIYYELRGVASAATLHPSWILLSFASKIAQSLGLHRDISRWNLDLKTVNRRRHMFWDMICNETFTSMSMGRPIGIRHSYVDAKIAADVGMVNSDGQHLMGFFRWKHEFVSSLYSDVVETLLVATPPKYETILQLDRKIREVPIPAHLNTLFVNEQGGNFDHITPRLLFHSSLPGLIRSALMLFVHRAYFSRALQDTAGDPTKTPLMSPFAPSFLAAYRAASWIAKCQRVFWKRFPELLTRLWHSWTHLLSASMILGCLVIYNPSCLMVDSALSDLNSICAMYETAAANTVSLRTKSGWKLLQRIQHSANAAYTRHKNSGSTRSEIVIHSPDFGEDELAMFGGQTRLLVSKSSSSKSTPSPPQNLPQNLPQPQEIQQPQATLQLGDVNLEVHPSLVQFLNTAPVTQFASFNELDTFFGLDQAAPPAP
ncbi:hypothetical protein DL96DRAFT_1594737, partial [Flagelloscypha sp. PMI_526]